MCWEQLEYGLDNIKNLHYGLIHVGLPTLVDLSKEALPSIKDNVPINFELCKEGDVAFADASEDTNEVCKAVEFYKLCNQRVVCGLHTIHGRDNAGKTVIGFKGYAFSSSAFHNQIRRIAQGTKIYSINVKNFSECHIGIPSKAEQTKIADFLRLLDERIAAQRALIGEMGRLIGGIREWLFAHQQEMKKCLLGDILVEYSERNHGNSREVVAVGKSGIRKREELFSRELSKDYSANKVIRKNTLTIGMGSNQIDFGILLDDKEFCVSPAYTTYQIVGVDSAYLQELLTWLNPILSFKYMITSVRQGKTVNKDELMRHPINLCADEEQHRIQHILSTVGKKIELERDALNLYQRQKQFFLQQLFI